MKISTLLRCLPLSLFTTSNADKEEGNHGTDILHWLSAKNGFVNTKIEIRQIDSNQDSSPFGVFTKERMNPKEKIFIIPDEAIISPKGEVNVVAMTCELVETLVKEMILGDDSEYAPYVKHLLSLTSSDQLPSMWSEVGQKSFLEVMGEDDGINILPPDDPFDWTTVRLQFSFKR